MMFMCCLTNVGGGEDEWTRETHPSQWDTLQEQVVRWKRIFEKGMALGNRNIPNAPPYPFLKISLINFD